MHSLSWLTALFLQTVLPDHHCLFENYIASISLNSSLYFLFFLVVSSLFSLLFHTFSPYFDCTCSDIHCVVMPSGEHTVFFLHGRPSCPHFPSLHCKGARTFSLRSKQTTFRESKHDKLKGVNVKHLYLLHYKSVPLF